MRRFDCVIYAGEADWLECRMTELDEVIDRFVVVEAHQTHQGQPKPLHSPYMDERFKPWWDRLIYYPVHLPDPGGPRGGAGSAHYQVREKAHRDLIGIALLCSAPNANDEEPKPNDVILVSDVDEIPKREAAGWTPEPGHILTLQNETYCMAVDWRWPGQMTGTAICRYDFIQRYGVQFLREHRAEFQMVPSSGWHFTWIGGPEAWAWKRDAFSHAELRGKLGGDDLICRWVKGYDVNGVQLQPWQVDDTYPVWFRDRTPSPWWHRPRLPIWDGCRGWSP
jgi:beta-1,4-mannosyl-glycoprotein beta-1,4-N-acetylglucosaminyltransferase